MQRPPRTSPTSGPASPSPPSARPSQRLAQETYVTASVAHGVWDGDAFRGVHVDQWRQFFYAKHTGDTAEAKKKAFQRVRVNMVNVGLLVVQDDVYLTPDGDIQTK